MILKELRDFLNHFSDKSLDAHFLLRREYDAMCTNDDQDNPENYASKGGFMVTTVGKEGKLIFVLMN